MHILCNSCRCCSISRAVVSETALARVGRDSSSGEIVIVYWEWAGYILPNCAVIAAEELS